PCGARFPWGARWHCRRAARPPCCRRDRLRPRRWRSHEPCSHPTRPAQWSARSDSSGPCAGGVVRSRARRQCRRGRRGRGGRSVRAWRILLDADGRVLLPITARAESLFHSRGLLWSPVVQRTRSLPSPLWGGSARTAGVAVHQRIAPRPPPPAPPHKGEGSTPNTRRRRAHAKLSEKRRPALTGERRAVVSALSIPLSVCQWIGPQLDMYGARLAALAALHQPGRAIAVGAPQPAALPAGVGIIDAPVEALGIKAHGVGDAQHHHLPVLERDEAVVEV